MPKILVTAALPYANGPLHLGHLASTYLPADIFSRYHRLRGNDVVFVCASDEHGTPIEINAAKAKVSPEEFVKKYHEEHAKDFAAMGVSFDIFYHTHSPENKKMADFFFESAKKAGAIFKKKVMLTYCEHCKRYLPDRYVKGECPNCGALDQYGDVCEACGRTYSADELKNPRCAVCGNTPVKKEDEHYFFKLSVYEKTLKEYFESNKNLQPDVRNYVLGWLKEGLKDWDITRNGPYFGFKIPGEEDKYYYVWLDAPIGYVSSTVKWAGGAKRNWEDFWKKKDAKIYHFIGKDIIYFHYLFWPALVSAAGFELPFAIPTRGYLTVEGEKMSKSRGTFILVRDYLNRFPPDYLRYYLSSATPNTTADVNFSWKEFRAKCNSDLADAFGNFAHRVLTFVSSRYGGVAPGPKKFSKEDEEFDKLINTLHESAGRHMEEAELKRALEEIFSFVHECNRYFNEATPWKSVNENREKCDTSIFLSLKALGALSVVLRPFMPETCAALAGMLGIKGFGWDDAAKAVSGGQKIGKLSTLFRKIEDEEISGKPRVLLEKSKHPVPAQESGGASDKMFRKLSLKTGKIISAIDHPDADKLYVLGVDFGGEKRPVVAGIKGAYKKEDIIGKTAVFLSNLHPAKIRGVESQAMVLVADDGKGLSLLFCDTNPGDMVFAEGITSAPAKEVSFDEFKAVEMKATNERNIEVGGKILLSGKKKIFVQNVSPGAKVR